MTYKICVTGSREWPMTGEKSWVISRLLDTIERMGNKSSQQVELWQGECPYGGVDALSAAYGESRGWIVRSFPPKPSNGHTELRAMDYAKRNRAMVDAGPDVVVAFFLNGAGNRGTQMTYDMSKGLYRLKVEA